MSATDAFATLTRPDAAADERVAAVDDLKRALSQALEGRRVTEGSVVLERAHRLRQRLDSLRPHARKGRLDPITDAVADLRPSYEAFLQEAQALPVETAPTQNRAGTPALFRNVLTVARKEVVLTLQGTQGVVLFLLLLLTFGVGLEAVLGSGVPGAAPSVELAWRYAHSLDFLSVPLVGILLGYHLLNEERQLGTIHFLGSKPVTRGGIVLGKWLGMAAVLGVLVSASALIVGGVAWSASGALGDALVVVGFPVATFLLALAFASIAFVMSALLDRGSKALGAGIGAYVLLGIAWQNAFYLRQLSDGGAVPSAARIIGYLASPFTAWFNWTTEMLGPRSAVSGLPIGDAWHEQLVVAVEQGTLDALPFYATTPFYILVLVAWCGLGILAAGWAFRARDLA